MVIEVYRGRRIGVAVPAYNECLLIGDTLKTMPDFVDRIYVVDDASTDNTFELVKAMVDCRIIALHHEVNGGVGAAVVTAYKQALSEEMDITAVMAGDNQMDPAYLPHLIDPIVEGIADFTKGDRLANRNLRTGMSPWRLLGNIILTHLTRIASGYWRIRDPQNGYVAISRRALSFLDLDSVYRGFAFENDLLVKLNVQYVNVVNVPIPARYGRETSKIKYGPFIVKTAAYLMRAFIWRITKKYIVRDHSRGTECTSSVSRRSEHTR